LHKNAILSATEVQSGTAHHMPGASCEGSEVKTVLSWLGEHKAVAMAVEVHLGGWWALRESWLVPSVAVEDLGLAPLRSDGTVGEGPPGCLEDRMEF
jgi:hypothetical protein